MKALCVVITVVGIVVDEENGSSVRHDHYNCAGKLASVATLRGPLREYSLGYAPTEHCVNWAEVGMGAVSPLSD